MVFTEIILGLKDVENDYQYTFYRRNPLLLQALYSFIFFCLFFSIFCVPCLGILGFLCRYGSYQVSKACSVLRQRED